MQKDLFISLDRFSAAGITMLLLWFREIFQHLLNHLLPATHTNLVQNAINPSAGSGTTTTAN